jgi:hypothetical protein
VLLWASQTGDKGDMAVLLQQRKRAIVGQLGIAPETLSRVLRHLRERSLISGSCAESGGSNWTALVGWRLITNSQANFCMCV